MVESSFGRRWSLAGSTFVTAVFCVLFIYAESSFAVLFSTAGVSLSSTVSLRSCYQILASPYFCMTCADHVGRVVWVSRNSNHRS